MTFQGDLSSLVDYSKKYTQMIDKLGLLIGDMIEASDDRKQLYNTIKSIPASRRGRSPLLPITISDNNQRTLSNPMQRRGSENMPNLINSPKKDGDRNPITIVSSQQRIPFHFQQLCSMIDTMVAEHGKNKIMTRLLRNGCLSNNSEQLRSQLWVISMDVKTVNANEYQSLVAKGKCADIDADKIERDIDRTFASCKQYTSRVSGSTLGRLLNAYFHSNPRKRYCQGMNCVAGILLYAMPELEAYSVFSKLMNELCPTYFHSDTHNDHKSSLIGAWSGSIIAWKVLEIVDKELFNHVSGVHPFQYLFPIVQSMLLLAQPFEEVLKVFDFMFTVGIQWIPIVVVAHMIMNRNSLLTVHSTNVLMEGLLSQRKWLNGRLDACAVIRQSMDIIQYLKSNPMYRQLCTGIQTHCLDIRIAAAVKESPNLTLGLTDSTVLPLLGGTTPLNTEECSDFEMDDSELDCMSDE